MVLIVIALGSAWLGYLSGDLAGYTRHKKMIDKTREDFKC